MDDIEAFWITEAGQIAQAVGVAARALRDDPDWTAISDDPLVRLEMLSSMFAGSLGEARVAGVPSGEASDADRLLHFRSILAAHDLDEPHWHVGPVGVEPGFQSMGMGGAAMRLLCEEFDEHGRVSWVKTAKRENLRFYGGLGFEVVDESPMLSAHLWFMRRQPH